MVRKDIQTPLWFDVDTFIQIVRGLSWCPHRLGVKKLCCRISQGEENIH